MGIAEVDCEATVQNEQATDDGTKDAERRMPEGELEAEHVAEQQTSTDHLQPQQPPPAGDQDLDLDGEMALDDDDAEAQEGSAGGGEDGTAAGEHGMDDGADAAPDALACSTQRQTDEAEAQDAAEADTAMPGTQEAGACQADSACMLHERTTSGRVSVCIENSVPTRRTLPTLGHHLAHIGHQACSGLPPLAG